LILFHQRPDNYSDISTTAFPAGRTCRPYDATLYNAAVSISRKRF
jgi:hypothetical protein